MFKEINALNDSHLLNKKSELSNKLKSMYT